jgi:hypothetical protein
MAFEGQETELRNGVFDLGSHGSLWMDQALEQHRELHDIYSSLISLQKGMVAEQLIEFPADPRLRTIRGRELVAAEIQAQKNGLAGDVGARKAAGIAVIDDFADIFSML